MANECRCHNLTRRKLSLDLKSRSAGGDAVGCGNPLSDPSHIQPFGVTKSSVSCKCLTTFTAQGQLKNLVVESVLIKRRTISLLIHQLNEVRRELAAESNGKTVAKFYLDQANYELNRIKSTPLSEVIALEMQNYKLEQTNRLLLKQFDQMKKVIAN